MPAAEYASGSKEWYKHGELHREGDQPASIDADGEQVLVQSWYKHGYPHRDGDLPAYIDSENGETQWWKESRQHRYIGPAQVLMIDGYVAYTEFYAHGRQRKPRSILGESHWRFSATSWFTVLCFI